MKLVAITTSSPRSMVALAENRTVVASTQRMDARGHAGFVVPGLEFCFDQVGWMPTDLDAVIVDIGPGFYTGLRVGLATAQGLAAAVGASLVPVVSLDALAIRASTNHRLITAVTSIRRGELAMAQYRPVPGGVVRETTPRLVTTESLMGIIAIAENNLLVGDLETLPGQSLQGDHRVKTGRPRFPDGGAMVEIGMTQLHRDNLPHPDEIRPLYLRAPEVSINWSRLRPPSPWEQT